MNTRLRFKLIALLIVLSLTGLLVFQGYWLKGLYDTLYKQMEINIEEAMKIADYKELFLRIRTIKEEQGNLGLQTQEVYFGSDKGSPNAHLDMRSELPYGQQPEQQPIGLDRYSGWLTLTHACNYISIMVMTRISVP